jgi:hypothetical protein
VSLEAIWKSPQHFSSSFAMYQPLACNGADALIITSYSWVAIYKSSELVLGPVGQLLACPGWHRLHHSLPPSLPPSLSSLFLLYFPPSLLIFESLQLNPSPQISCRTPLLFVAPYSLLHLRSIHLFFTF